MNKKLIIVATICFFLTIQVNNTMALSSFLNENGGEIDLFAKDSQEKNLGSENPYVIIDSTNKIKDNASLMTSKEQTSGAIRIVSSMISPESWSSGNFLISTDMLTRKSDVSGEFLNKYLVGTELFGLGPAFKRAEENYGVNAIFLMGLAMHESNGGASRIAREKNNLFGFQAYDSSPLESARTFASKEESIDVVARYISKNYLLESGKYFKGYSIEAMNVHYATDPNWARGIKRRISHFFIMSTL